MLTLGGRIAGRSSGAEQGIAALLGWGLSQHATALSHEAGDRAALPTLDAVVISHDHYDHLDYATILGLAPRDMPFITSLGVGAHLEAGGVPVERIIELDWWEQTTYVDPKHHGAGIGTALYRQLSGLSPTSN